jgi:hypothetical protein
VRDAEMWRSVRRNEILDRYRTEMFGRAPGTVERVDLGVDPLDGRAVRKQVSFGLGASAPRMRILMYLPATKKPAPIVLGLSFTDQNKVDPAAASQWQLDQILAHGYGLATIFYGDIEPDVVGGIKDGVRPLFFKPGQTEPAAHEWGALAAWAWGLSSALDYLETDSAVDASRVMLVGHSRLGKATLWAALDERFAVVISNESGEGGAALARRCFGERTADLNRRFPHWYAGNFRKFDGREDEIPFDSHMLLSLIAPRPLYVASAEEDRWADPRGEFLAAVHAGPVYELFGKHGIGTIEMPKVHEPVGETVRYHIRTGKHDVTAYDWEQYLEFADKYLRQE